MRATWPWGAVAFVLAVGCATTGGEGSETHFVCSNDAQCEARGEGVCIEKRCVLPDSGAGGSGGGTTSSGGVQSASGGRSSGSGGVIVDDGPAPPAALCPAGDRAWNPGGFAPKYSCHETLFTGASLSCTVTPSDRDCSARSIIHPSELPCGACTVGDRCRASVAELCDCDGEGPEPSFLQFPNDDIGYFDGWLCQCNGGQWECLLETAISGISCFQVCPREVSDAGLDGG